MPQPRATAQQAIEVLKIHQLRKENVVIFEEIKHLRGEVTSRQNELNDTLKQVANLKVQLNDAVDRAADCNKKLEVLSSVTDRSSNKIEGLRQDHERAKDDLIGKIEAQQVAVQKTNAVTEFLRGDIVQLRKQVDDSDNKTADVVNDMNQDLNVKADGHDVVELEDRLQQLIRDLELRLENHESVSRVTDTAERRVGRTSGEVLSS